MTELKKNDNSSWEVINENVAIKQTDLSALKYNEIRVTNEVKNYFVLENMEKHERREIFLHFNNVAYPCVIYLDAFKKGRGKLRWGKKFKKVFQDLVSGYFFENDDPEVLKYVDPPLLRFQKIDYLNYKICFIFNKEIIENTIEIDDRTISEHERYKIYEENFIKKIETFKLKGTECSLCGFNYLNVYGDAGKGREEIHLVNIEKEDNEKEYIPICSNCHKLLHSGYSEEDLKNQININREISKTFK